MARGDRPLYRDSDDQKIGGVCSGLAHYLDLDPLLVRVAFVAGLVSSGATLIAYLLLWWPVDAAPAGSWDDATTDDATPATREDVNAATDDPGDAAVTSNAA